MKMGARLEEQGSRRECAGRDNNDTPTLLGTTVYYRLYLLSLYLTTVFFYTVIGNDILLSKTAYIHLLRVLEPRIDSCSVRPHLYGTLCHSYNR